MAHTERVSVRIRSGMMRNSALASKDIWRNTSMYSLTGAGKLILE